MQAPTRALPLPACPSIAVLPFARDPDDFDLQSFADGVSDHITYALACTRGLFVSGRNSAFTFKGRPIDPGQVGAALGVAHLLEGTIARADERVAVSARLRAVADGAVLWSRDLEGGTEAIFAIQAAIVEGTVRAIAPDLPFDASGIERTRFPAGAGVYAQFLAAYSNYTAGSEESIRALVGSIDAITRLMPDQALPLALKAQCYSYLVIQGWSRDIAADAAEGLRAAHAALGQPRAEESPAVLMMVGHTFGFFGHDHEAAVALLARSLSLNPNSAAAYERSGWVHCFVGRPETAAAHFRAAKRQSPLDGTAFRFESGLGLALCMLGEHEAAVEAVRSAIRDAPIWTTSYRVLAASLASLGRADEARAAARDLLRLEPGYRIGASMRLYRDSPGRARFVEGLRRAGLPA